MEKIKYLYETRIEYILFKFYFPAFIGMASISIYNIIDRIFIGQYAGYLGLSGFNLAYPVIIIMNGFGLLIGGGASLLVSVELGKGDSERANKIVGNALFLIIVSSLLLIVAIIPAKNSILKLLGATDITIGYADQYITIILCGSIFSITAFSLNALLRSAGMIRESMRAMLFSMAINIALDAVFIARFNMGIKGAAYAAVLTQILTIALLVFYFSRRSILKFHPVTIQLDMSIIRKILFSGLAPFAMQVSGSIIQILFNTNLVRYGGDAAVASMSIINTISSFIMMSIVALNVASQPVLGCNHGAGNYKRVRETFILVIKYSTAISVAWFVILELLPGFIIRFFNGNDELLLTCIPGMRMTMLKLPVVGFQIVAINYFQSTGHPKMAIIMTFVRQFLLLLPLLFIMPRFLGINGVWLSSPVSDWLSTLFVLVIVVAAFIELRKKIG